MDGNVSDESLAEKLRVEDPEQFFTLVKMHLSFVLDLSTDDCLADKSKLKALFKWNFVPFAKKNKGPPLKGVMEGAPLTQEGICQVYQLIEFLGKEPNIKQEGIFRRSGKMTRQQELKNLLNQGATLNLNDGHFSVHDCASVLKNFLADLPEPLLTDNHYPAYCQIAELCGAASKTSETNRNSELRLLRALQLLLLLLPAENRVLLRDVLRLLRKTADFEGSNKMSADSLATLFTPHLLCPRKLSPESLHTTSQTMSGVVSFMIQNGRTMFSIPPKLGTDIKAYWVERERKKQTVKLNESVCDGTAANTVFSFVDRERTAQAHISNPTEAALAQLYAYIQSLPESSKKRKLVKQFNKENGNGTPLKFNQHQKLHLRSKSLGESIKRHIPVFSRSIKVDKSPSVEGHVNVFRSSSEELLNTPTMTSMKKSFLHKSLDDKNSVSDNSPLFSRMPVLKDSLMTPTTKTSALRLRYAARCRIPVTVSQEDSNGSLERLKELSSQVAELKKDIAEEVEEVPECSPPKIPCLQNHSVTPPPSKLSPKGTESIPLNDIQTPSSECVPVTPCAVPCVALPGLISSSECGSTNGMLAPSSHKAWASSTPAVKPKERSVLNQSNLLLTPITNGNTSMSPITKSTQKMPKAMQETMMTPRSRKPVVVLSGSNICHLANVSSWEKDGKTPATNMNNNCHENGNYSCHDTCEDLKHKHNSNKSEENVSMADLSEGKDDDSLENESSLTSTFRSYLYSRSILTTSPVDLSFSSRTEDFDSSSFNDKVLSEGMMSDSLMYCMDGNDPSGPDQKDCADEEGFMKAKQPKIEDSISRSQIEESISNQSPKVKMHESYRKGKIHETSL